jgi:hypothetical protein
LGIFAARLPEREDVLRLNPIFAGLQTSIFEEMSALARQHSAINLGQGFPDDPGPEDVRRKAAEAVIDGWNQYPPMMGLPELRAAIARHYKIHQDIDIDATGEVMVTSGRVVGGGGFGPTLRRSCTKTLRTLRDVGKSRLLPRKTKPPSAVESELKLMKRPLALSAGEWLAAEVLALMPEGCVPKMTVG